MERNQKRESSSRLGYIAAAVFGVAAGLVAKAIYDDIKEEAAADEKYQTDTLRDPMSHPTGLTRPQNLSGRTDPEDYIATNDELCCPITKELMRDPVFSRNCGHTFDRKSIEGWLNQSNSCPLCKKTLTRSDLIPNYNLKNLIQKLA